MQVSPLMMKLRNEAYEFPNLPHDTFRGLPGLLADSLPDRFGNLLIDAWLARQGRPAESFSTLERLCYIGVRGMGALEFKPAIEPSMTHVQHVEIEQLVELANQVLDERNGLQIPFSRRSEADSLHRLLSVGTSAGGARAKAVVAWNPTSNEVRSGQVKTDPGFEYWILKFDGIHANRDRELADPQGFGAIEYAYSLMAKEAGIAMSDCRLLEENGRRHFMTNRFDRLPGGEKLHMQSLCGLAHYDFNQARAYSYEQALMAIRSLGLPRSAAEELFRRAVFNIVARNQDDHVKNIAFLMNRAGQWSLAPAYDLTFSFNPDGAWTNSHQITLNGKADNFDTGDLVACAKTAGISRRNCTLILDQVLYAVSQWRRFAEESNIPEFTINSIEQTHRKDW